MAPVAPPLYIDYRTLVIENCRFFNRQDAKVTLITALEALGSYKAVILKDENGKREALLSATEATLAEALQVLHQKSCEAVQNYMGINGVDHVPGSSKPRRRGKRYDDDDSVLSCSCTSTLALSDSEDGSSTCESLSDGDTISIASGGKRGAKKHRKSHKRGSRHSKNKASTKTSNVRRPRSRSRGQSRSRSRSRSSSWAPSIHDNVVPRRRPAPPMPFWTPVAHPARPTTWVPPPPGVRPVTNPPPPPPGPAMMPTRGSPMSMGSPSSPAGAVGPKPSPPLSINLGPLHDVRLHIHWKGHGKKLVLEQSRASLRAIQDTALAWVRRNANSFSNVMNFDVVPSRLSALRATVSQASIGEDSYEMSSYGSDNLGKLMRVAGAATIPRFEVEIEMPPCMFPPGAMRPGKLPTPPASFEEIADE